MFKTKRAAMAAALISLAPVSALAGPGGSGHSHDEASLEVGEPGDPKKPARTIPVSMREVDGKMLYFPNKIEVRKGEQVRFVLTNAGDLNHEFVLGTVEENAKHYELMKKFPEMEHEDANAKQLQSKAKENLVWRFTKSGEFEFACLHPGHYEAGMKGKIIVR